MRFECRITKARKQTHTNDVIFNTYRFIMPSDFVKCVKQQQNLGNYVTTSCHYDLFSPDAGVKDAMIKRTLF